ncbi:MULTISPECIES: hypothetical protein [Buttiauxella]|jgi:hypothetical protein|uniref:Dimeric alpha-beta barrel protein n=1 Tax=Buttiauxella ferragutiae ATCC 51602 TaxID=1354252 RepID=A0ABX2W5C7_9ENTR|nr:MULTISPECIES: hypothetical protein [Buttiauxella]AYN26039.1 monooxygenase [Buttiauxella sp. 3AFRM03]MCE0824688.1 hypothetical protein [Buttiauxella ferragutiae]OAT25958.1 dimeric alpha-beta barrel protein [Buttiauxella ferragutiae ATCC 51602]TDN54278.1 hypothetical protein EC843_101319 [Buttiauxella sp. JUb87]
MITVIVTMKLNKAITREEGKKIFLSTAPRYKTIEGLVRKYYILSEDGISSGGVYLWTTKAAAEAWYTDSWHEFIKETYNTTPSITYWESPVIVDNILGCTTSDDQEL